MDGGGRSNKYSCSLLRLLLLLLIISLRLLLHHLHRQRRPYREFHPPPLPRPPRSRAGGRSADPENCAMLCLLLLHDMGFRENHLQQRRKGRPKPRPQKIRGERNECAPVTLCFTRCNALQPSPIPVKFGLGARDEDG